MESMKFSTLHKRAKAALESAHLPSKRLFLFYALGLVLPTLVIEGLYYCLLPLCSTGYPLSSGNFDAILISANGTLNFLFTLFQIFWGYSLTVCLLKISRNAAWSTDNLKDSFRLWKRVIGAVFFRSLRLFLLAIVASMAAYILAIFLLGILPPAILIVLVIAVMAAILVPGWYSLWAVPYLAVDSEGIPAMALCGLSRRLMQGKRKNVFFLELHYIWYELLFGLLSSFPTIYSLTQIDFPALLQSIDWTSPNAAEMLSEALSVPTPLGVFPWTLLVLLAQCALSFLYYIWKYGEIQMTYTMAYNAIVEDQMPKDRPQLDAPDVTGD